jgi:hypothetical protein
MRLCDESVFEFIKMRRENRWGKKRENLIRKVGGTRLFMGTFASQVYRTRSVRQIIYRENGNLRVD